MPTADLMPPAFADGLSDWSWGDGTPDGPAYDEAPFARLATGDPDFGTCLEVRKVEPVQRLRYMGELPLPCNGFVEVSARVKVLRGPLPAAVRIAAFAGGAQGSAVPGLALAGAAMVFPCHATLVTVRAVIGREARPGVDLVWDERALYAHVGLDLTGPDKGVVRVESIAVHDVTPRFRPEGALLPGFAEAARPLARP